MVKKMRKKLKVFCKNITFEIFALFALVLTMALFWKHNIALTALYLLTFVVLIFVLHNKEDLTLFLIAAIFFQIGEIIMVYSGAWTYNNPSYLGIPIWITLSWGYSVIIIKKLAETIHKLYN